MNPWWLLLIIPGVVGLTLFGAAMWFVWYWTKDGGWWG